MKKQTANRKEWKKWMRECDFYFNSLEVRKDI